MPSFSYSSVIDAPIDVIWQFHERPDVLNVLTPSWQSVEVVRREGGLDVGAVSEFRLWFGPIPVQWLAQHIECDRPYLFTDEQVQGPFDQWVHRHCFEALEGDRTCLTDVITYTLPGGLVGYCLGNGYVQQELKRLFTYRHQVTQQLCCR
ncbi:MAG: SRPBCC family protein [Synechococcales cyanobacterium T60_A2020_003]|nr:SRPBCC family protein [Synechococcales cyanobacterium T60_A2020_003]